ncbi:Hypothetical predicted protein, partial [Pelobates cultripes]
MLRVRDASERADILQQLGLTTNASRHSTMAPATAFTTWDPDRITPFVPAARRGDVSA